MKKNDKVQVAKHAPYHQGRVGYFQFVGEGVSSGCAVLSHEPDGTLFFVVKTDHLEPLASDE